MRSAIEAAIAAERSALRAAVAAEAAEELLEETSRYPREPAHYSATPLEPAPCERCQHSPRGGALQLACAVFHGFVNGDDAPRWSTGPRVPSRVEFLAIFGPRRRKPRRPAGQRSNQELMQQFLLED